MKKTPEDFEKAVKERGIQRWNIHDCSMCGYSCGYVFNIHCVSYDSGCDCVIYNSIRQSSWVAVAEQYNMQTDPSVIEKMNKFWSF